MDDSLRPTVIRVQDRHIITCGCCDKQVEIYAGAQCNGESEDEAWIEINGVMATYGEWKLILKKMVDNAS